MWDMRRLLLAIPLLLAGSAPSVGAQSDACVYVVELELVHRGVPVESHEVLAIRVTRDEQGFRVESDPGGWLFTTDPPTVAQQLNCDEWNLEASRF